MKIFVLGGISYDTLIHVNTLPDPDPQTIFPKRVIHSIGSTGAGKAIPLSKLGLNVTLHGLIGHDEFGNIIKDILHKEKVNFIYDIDPKGTEIHTNIMADDGKRISIYTNPSTFEPIIDNSKIEQAIIESDVIFMNIINYSRRFIKLAKKHYKPLWIDIHDYDGLSSYHQDFIDAADVILMSKDLMNDPKPFVDKMIEQNKEAIFITDGKNGVTGYYQNNEVIHIDSIFPKHKGDFNGAGDHFLSGYLYAYLNHYEKEECLKAGVICATACIESDTISNDVINENWLKERLKEFVKI